MGSPPAAVTGPRALGEGQRTAPPRRWQIRRGSQGVAIGPAPPRHFVFTLVRALVYAATFIGFLLVYVPGTLLSLAGVRGPGPWGGAQVAGAALALAGATLAIACVLAFALAGRGTPAPFDPPRRLVRSGPYGVVRNPMYWGAGLALAGAALFYGSLVLAAYAAIFLASLAAFVHGYEEPTLRRLFGDEYEDYCREVGRWWPRRTPPRRRD